MYNLIDYDDAKLLYEQRLREAEQRREHSELVQAALEHTAQENDRESQHLIQRLIHSRNQPRREHNVARRAPAV